MSALVDTSVLIDVLRGVPAAVDALRDARAVAPLQSSVVVRAEVLAGMRPEEEEATAQLLGALDWHDVTADVAEGAGRMGRRWLRSHSGIDTADLLIAATASRLRLPLMTRNTRHFPMFPDLMPPY
ncbi:type II toxin-antitoxin system VapC family toxin [soil metagenome]